MQRNKNVTTQPFTEQPVFNNWDVVAKGWYLICLSSDIKKGRVKSFNLCGQRIVIFRGNNNRCYALDAFCPHMGADLGIGKVIDNSIRCFFHHWKYNGEGDCVDVPCGESIPSKAKVRSYGTEERYGHIWVYPDANPPAGVPEYDSLKGKEVYWERGSSVTRECHHHINMINGIDAQHLRTVHNISMDMVLSHNLSEDGRIMDFTLTGPLPTKTRRERLLSTVLGGTYAYSMRYAEATVGLLSVFEKVRWFGKGKEATPMRMIFAYTPLSYGISRTVPIFIAEKKPGLWNTLKAKLLLFSMKVGLFILRDEDGVVYDNIRFQPNALLKMDRAVAQYIKWVNKLPLSDWSTTGKKRPTVTLLDNEKYQYSVGD